jgi:MerR HTH family regulatory protein
MSAETIVYDAEITILTLTEFVGVSGWSVESVQHLVEIGILMPSGGSEGDWRFEAGMVSLARRLRRLQDDLEVELTPQALALSYRLLERIQELEIQLEGQALAFRPSNA